MRRAHWRAIRERDAGIPVYGVSGLFIDVDDYRGHGFNARVLVKSLYDSHEYLYRLVKTLAGAKSLLAGAADALQSVNGADVGRTARQPSCPQAAFLLRDAAALRS